jgi:hypothetical protein
MLRKSPGSLRTTSRQRRVLCWTWSAWKPIFAPFAAGCRWYHYAVKANPAPQALMRLVHLNSHSMQQVARK